MIAISDADSFAMTRRLAREEGLLVGGSSGLAVAAALKVAANADPDDVIVVILPDGGRGYLSKIFNDDWMADYGFLRESSAGPTVGDLLAARQTRIPALVHVHPDETVAQAIALLREYDVSQLPVVQEEPPLMAAEVAGSVAESDLLDALVSGRATPQDPISGHMSPPLPVLGQGEPVSSAAAVLEKSGAALVHVEGKPAAVLTRADLLAYYATATAAERGKHRRRTVNDETLGFETLAIHAGQDPDPITGAVVPPIYQTSTYKQDGVGGTRGGYEYSRTANPTRTALETCLAALENGAAALAFASGMAAEDCLIRTLCRPGDRVLIPGDAYGGTFRLFDKVLVNWGVEYRSVTQTDLEAVARAAAEWRPKLIWAETPTNPLLSIVDIRALAEIAHESGALLVVDNTFASPYLQRPLDLGADIVVHSTTKYIGGHSDVVGGAVIVRDQAHSADLHFTQNATGAVAGPFDAWLTLRGIKTLGVRMDRHCANAARVAAMLADHPAVESVFYPGLAGHPGHEIAKSQMRDFGGMVSFRVRGGEEAAVERLRAHPAVQPGRVARRRRVADRAPGPDDARLRRRVPARGAAGPGPAVGRHRGPGRPAGRPEPGARLAARRLVPDHQDQDHQPDHGGDPAHHGDPAALDRRQPQAGPRIGGHGRPGIGGDRRAPAARLPPRSAGLPARPRELGPLRPTQWPPRLTGPRRRARPRPCRPPW